MTTPKLPLHDSHPDIASSWDFLRNTPLKPKDVTAGSNKSVWWICSKCGQGWKASIFNRTGLRSGCPYCSGRKVTKETSFGGRFPDLVAEWDVDRNLPLDPYEIAPRSSKKVWWKCIQCGEVWQAAISGRTDPEHATGCPYCKGTSTSASNSLAAINSTLSAEWDIKKNAPLTPSDVRPGSHKKVWWNCANGHTFKSEIKSRAYGAGCPFCAGQRATTENNFLSSYPDLAKLWHTTKNEGISLSNLAPKSHKKVWWHCDSGHDWQMNPAAIVRGQRCPYCAGKRVSTDNCLATVNPLLAKEWHPTKNRNLYPQDLVSGSHKKVWWKCARGHEWLSALHSRHGRGDGCPECSVAGTSAFEIRVYSELKNLFGKVSWRDKSYGIEIDLLLPELAVAVEVDGYYWHKDKQLRDKDKSDLASKHNVRLIHLRQMPLEKIEAWDVLYSPSEHELAVTKRLVEAICVESSALLRNSRIDDYLHGDDFVADGNYRKLVANLPAPPFENSFAKTNPHIATQWNYERNAPLTPEMFTGGSGRLVWWRCAKANHEWSARIVSRSTGQGCPFCAGRRVTSENALALLRPDVAELWNLARNAPLTPDDVTVGSSKSVWWTCGRCSGSWKRPISQQTRSQATIVCPKCAESDRLKHSAATRRARRKKL